MTPESVCEESNTLPACNDPDIQPVVSFKTSAPLVPHLPGVSKHYVCGLFEVQ